MSNLFAGIYMGRKVFITGNSGFKGSWLHFLVKQLEAEVTGYSLAPLTNPAHSKLLFTGG